MPNHAAVRNLFRKVPDCFLAVVACDKRREPHPGQPDLLLADEGKPEFEDCPPDMARFIGGAGNVCARVVVENPGTSL